MEIQSYSTSPYSFFAPSAGASTTSRADLESENSVQGVGDLSKSVVKSTSGSGEKELTEEEQRVVQKLQKRDAEVRQHEQAHLAAAGALAIGGAQYQYQTGPDDKRYAIGGHVKISLREGATPEESVALARQAQRAALAPAEPSSQDYKVAAEAAAMEVKAKAELTEEQAEEESEEESEPDRPSGFGALLDAIYGESNDEPPTEPGSVFKGYG